MDNKDRAQRIESLSVAARLQDLAVHMREGESSRMLKIYAVLERLEPGVYLVGAGPYTQGVFSLSSDEIVVGRMATALEEPLDQPVDLFVNDGVTLTPREVSRIHCAIVRRDVEGEHGYFLSDRGSTCGTLHNGRKLEPTSSTTGEGLSLPTQLLSDGDVISLGSSGINNYVFVDLRGQV